MPILFVKLGAIGDVVMAMTAAQRRVEESGVRIAWMAGKTVEPLIRRWLPQIELVSVNDKALLSASTLSALQELLRMQRVLRGARFDRVAIGYQDFRYRLLTLSARTQERVSFFYKPGIYHADLYYELLGGNPTHLISQPLHPSSLLKKSPPGKHWVLAPGGAQNILREDPLRRYPIQHYVTLAKWGLDQGKEVTILGAPSDDWVRAHFSSLPVKFEIGSVSLPELPLWLQQFERMFTHDSGPMHLALMAGIPTTALFGPTRSDEKIPKNYSANGSVVIQGGTHLPCAPCYDGKKYAVCDHPRCLADLQPSLEAFTAT